VDGHLFLELNAPLPAPGNRRGTSLDVLTLAAHDERRVGPEKRGAPWEQHMAKRTTHRSSKGTKLYAVRDKNGRFKDIQTYKRAHSADIKRKSKTEK
jgi:hypothetical protein